MMGAKGVGCGDSVRLFSEVMHGKGVVGGEGSL